MAGGVVITRRAFVVGLCWLAAGLSGCATARQPERPTYNDDDDDEPLSEGVRSKPPKGFFKKGSRLPGALSSEGSEIERNLGIQ